jgi:6-phosphogluconolactonase (cycloisomerase 2 family)
MTVREPSGRPVSVHAGIGPLLMNLVLDAPAGTLTRQGEAVMPSRVQAAWPHPRLPILYVACADRAPGLADPPFYLCAMLRDARGNLAMLGEPVRLPLRTIHLSTDLAGGHVLVAYGAAPGLTVRKLFPDGRIGPEVRRCDAFDPGVSPHQIRVMPSGRRAVLVSRGRKGAGSSYAGGRFNIVRFDREPVEIVKTVVPDPGGMSDGFNPRALDFHPAKPWAFVSLEGQNELAVFERDGDDLKPKMLFRRTMLADPGTVGPGQDGGTVRVHPNGRFVYAANRNDGGFRDPAWLTPDPVPAFQGGENSIAAFSIDQATGEPALIEVTDSGGIHPRSFSFDPSGQLLIVGNMTGAVMPGKVAVRANLALFRIGDDGRLALLRRYELGEGPEVAWWTGVMA